MPERILLTPLIQNDLGEGIDCKLITLTDDCKEEKRK